jgi:uncharacterized protein (TIGR00299 family) protein
MRRGADAAVMTGRTVWFNCCAGVAGDMLLASLVDAGADTDAITRALGGLGVDGYAVTFEKVQRCGVGATRANVAVNQPHHVHRPAREVFELIGTADLTDRVRDRALAVYRALAEVEGEIHGVDTGDVELHEVGALDSIIDVVGVCAALDVLAVDSIVCSPIAVGHGSVRTAHGELPNPVPAVIALLARAGAAAVGIDTTMETATPTGVALMSVLAGHFGAFPSITVTATGFGAGAADPPGRPNVVQVVIGDAVADSTITGTGITGTGRPARLVEANVDDVTGEVLAHTIAALLTAGAHDAWATPIVMKKGRPAHTVHALCDDATLAAVSHVMIVETGTLGMRATAVERWPQHRDERLVDVGGQPVRVKVSGSRVKAEHDDAAAAAAVLGIPLRDVLRRAETADHDGTSST